MIKEDYSRREVKISYNAFQWHCQFTCINVYTRIRYMIYLYETPDWRLSRVKAEKMMIELTGLCSVRGYGGGGR